MLNATHDNIASRTSTLLTAGQFHRQAAILSATPVALRPIHQPLCRVLGYYSSTPEIVLDSGLPDIWAAIYVCAQNASLAADDRLAELDALILKGDLEAAAALDEVIQREADGVADEVLKLAAADPANDDQRPMIDEVLKQLARRSYRARFLYRVIPFNEKPEEAIAVGEQWLAGFFTPSQIEVWNKVHDALRRARTRPIVVDNQLLLEIKLGFRVSSEECLTRC